MYLLGFVIINVLLYPIRFRVEVSEEDEEHHRLENAIPGVDDGEVAVDDEGRQSMQTYANELYHL